MGFSHAPARAAITAPASRGNQPSHGVHACPCRGTKKNARCECIATARRQSGATTSAKLGSYCIVPIGHISAKFEDLPATLRGLCVPAAEATRGASVHRYPEYL